MKLEYINNALWTLCIIGTLIIAFKFGRQYDAIQELKANTRSQQDWLRGWNQGWNECLEVYDPEVIEKPVTNSSVIEHLPEPIIGIIKGH